ncbi:hypothetical protein SAMN05216262_104123 [Colwellia chukchiensis]|uniref:Uncharacterized protein n=1 Tax=Colwellia chukchiensis TaxID=641665 RepID=A0A1H7LD16_9GAMM|nr:hypothetical protein [Colwellia chukchiensis]SEK96778.1 hypothetical protein SAMN05216262_104123 [Colwellia chukchiensis]
MHSDKRIVRAMISSSIFMGLLISAKLIAQTFTPPALQVGLWQGINGKLQQYNMLELNESGQHRFIKSYIATGFKRARVLNFTEQDIACSVAECIINIAQQGASTRLILAPYLDQAFQLLELNIDQQGHTVFSQSYLLEPVKSKSTVQIFMAKYRDKLSSLLTVPEQGIYGFWLGTLNKDGKAELVSFEANPNKKSYFTVFFNAQSLSNETSFLPEQVKVARDVTFISTEHPTFANQLIINQLSARQLSGYMYSVHRGQTLQTGHFHLTRVN